VLAVRELDRRRTEALDLHLQLRRHVLLAVGVAVAAGFMAMGGVSLLAARARRRPRRLRKARKRALARAWVHPERLATRAKESPLGIEVFRRVLITFASTFAARWAAGLARRLWAPG
jgi:hypothetical protein